jgi:hypothetical protein
VTINLTPPTEAGSNFENASTSSSVFAITSNVQGTKKRTLKASVNQLLNGTDFGVTLFIPSPFITGATTFNAVNTEYMIIPNFQNIVALGTLIYSVTPNDDLGPNGILPHGNTVITVTYTLSEDS